uniref:hypothetical protein n=1 Tax=Flavobacterium sp. TaxID=239 RepID=UPI004049FE8F
MLKLNDSSYISYRLYFKINKDDSVKGYSVTNMGGPHETKSYIIGKYKPASKEISFNENGIEYTKSDVTTYDFCYVHFNGKLKSSNGQNVLEGPFKGKFSDGISCIDGEIMVKNMKQIEKIAKKADKKIQRSNKIADSIKQNVSLSNLMDLNGLNVLKSDERTTMFTRLEEIKLTIWDAGKLDGDKISVFFNGKNLLTSYEIEKEKKILNLPLANGKNIIKLRADNLGEIAPNTAKIEILLGDKKIDLLSNLQKGEITSVVVIRQ